MTCSTCLLHCIHDHQPPWACPQAYLVVSIFSVEVSFFQNDSSVYPVCHSTMFITVTLSCVDHIHASSVPVSFPVVPFCVVVPFIHLMFFPLFYIGENIWYLSFCVWFYSANMIVSSSVCPADKMIFFYMAERILYWYMLHFLSWWTPEWFHKLDCYEYCCSRHGCVCNFTVCCFDSFSIYLGSSIAGYDRVLHTNFQIVYIISNI